VKNFIARATVISFVLSPAVVTSGQAGDYYIYHDADGKLAISNKEPPPGSKIIKQHSWPEATDSEVPQSQESGKPPPEGSPKPSKGK
jgi:hypothetical protein